MERIMPDFVGKRSSLSVVMQSAWAVAILVCLAAGVANAAAADAVKGSLTATRACPALQSIRKATNPGDVQLVVGNTYEVLAQNGRVPTHYRVRVDGAALPERWVGIDCGTYVAAAAAGGQAAGKAEAVLSLSWEPSFCETHNRKPECAEEKADDFDATHFTLHGLWPQSSEYCNVGTALA